MPTTERVTVTLPIELLKRIDRMERNRSRFIAVAVKNELARRRRAELLQSLGHAHREAVELAEVGLAEWAASLPSDAESFVDHAAGTDVRWVEGEGWVEKAK